MNYPLLRKAYDDGFDDGYFGHYKRVFYTSEVAREYGKGYEDGSLCREDADKQDGTRRKKK